MKGASNGIEWVELYNTTRNAINLGYCYTDDIAAGGNPPYEIPASTIIPAHGFWIADQVSYFNNSGDDVWSLSPLVECSISNLT